MSFDRARPYNALPKLPPKGIELETKTVLKKLIGARTALESLKETGKLLPDQAILMRTIGLQEAKLSSEIENIVTTQDALFRAFVDEGRTADPATKEVLAYKDALWHGFDVVKTGRPIATSLAERLASIIKGSQTTVRKVPGTRIENSRREVVYTPPDGEQRLRDMLANLDEFMHEEDDLDPLVRLAIGHYQFEAIHPFHDGNGRTGRILNILFLVERGLLDIPVLYLSRYILEHKKGYYGGLRGVTEEHAWEPWILYMLEAIEHMARLTRDRMLAIRELMEKTRARVQAELPKIYSKDLVEAIFRYPYTKVAFLEELKIGHRQTVTGYLRELARINVLEENKIGKELYFFNKPFWSALEGK